MTINLSSKIVLAIKISMKDVTKKTLDRNNHLNVYSSHFKIYAFGEKLQKTLKTNVHNDKSIQWTKVSSCFTNVLSFQ